MNDKIGNTFSDIYAFYYKKSFFFILLFLV